LLDEDLRLGSISWSRGKDDLPLRTGCRGGGCRGRGVGGWPFSGGG